MRPRPGTLAAIAAFLVWAALETAGLVLLVRTRSFDLGDGGNTVASSLRDALVACVFAGVGLLLAARLPRNTIGWLFLAIAGSLALGLVLERYALDALIAHPGSLPAGSVAAALSKEAWVILISTLILLLLVFPHGRLPSRRWRPMLALLVASAAATWVGGTTKPGPLPAPFAAHDNPLGVSALETPGRALFDAWALMLVPLVAAVVSLVQRYRRSRGVERQQYKWFVFAAALFPIVLQLTQVVDAAHWNRIEFAVSSLPAIASAFLPIATAIAILRYRLYEIDRLIGRTLVYGALTLVLGAGYVGLVLAGQALFSSFAGGSNLAIAVSTLVVAGLFLPVRSRMQHFVDRRFFRRRYDAQRTLEGFGARLREQIDLETLEHDLRGVVTETMQPAHAAVWLRTGTHR